MRDAGSGLLVRRLLGVVFGASLASATVAAAATFASALAQPGAWAAAAAVLGAVIAAALSALIGSYALSWRAAAWGVACGSSLGVLLQPAWTVWGLVAACWASAAVASLAIARERFPAVQRATSPALVAAVHTLQLPLMLFSLGVSLVSVRPRPFVVLFSLSAFALWRLLGGVCPLSRAELQLRSLRGEHAPALGEIGFIGDQIQRTTGIVVPRGAVAGLAYATAALAFAWYAVKALL
jgi:signal transduction histidine kinase